MDAFFNAFFSLPVFALLMCIAVALVLEKYRKIGKETPEEDDIKKFIKTVCRIIAFIGAYACLLIWSFVYPFPNSRYTNAPVYRIAHTGYHFTDSLVISRTGGYNALLGNLSGDMFLYSRNDATQLRYKQLGKPVYLKHHKSDSYTLQNPLTQVPVKSQLSIAVAGESLTLEIVKETSWWKRIHNNISCYYIAHAYGIADTSSNHAPIRHGTSLYDLITQERHTLNLSEPMISALNNVWIVKQHIKSNYESDPDAPLYLFLASLPEVSEAIQIDGNAQAIIPAEDNMPSGDIMLSSNDQFFTGITRVAYDSRLMYEYDVATNQKQITLGFPHYYPLKDSALNSKISINITNAEDTVIHSGNSNFLLIDKENTYAAGHAFSGILTYTIEPGNKPLHITCLDNVASSTNDTIINTEAPIILSCRQKMSWIFKVQNLNTTNRLTWLNMIGFSFVCILLAFLVVKYSYNKKKDISLINPFEICAMIIVITFVTIRMIFKWRAGVFLPDDISATYFTIFRKIDWTQPTVLLVFWLLLLAKKVVLINHKSPFKFGFKDDEYDDTFLKYNKKKFWIIGALGCLFLSFTLLLLYLGGMHFILLAGPIILIAALSLWYKFAAITRSKHLQGFFNKGGAVLWIFPLIVAVPYYKDMGFGFIYVLSFFLFWLIAFAIPWLKHKLKFNSYQLPIIIVIIFFAVLYGGLYKLTSHVSWDKLLQTKYRAQLIDKKMDAVLASASSDKEAQTCLKTAANQWLINTYSDSSSLYGLNGWTLRPHTSLGSNYFTQSNDLVILRYAIAENGKLFALLLIAPFLLLLIYRIRYNILDINSSEDTRADYNIKHASNNNDEELRLSTLNSFLNIDLFFMIFLLMLSVNIWLSATNNAIFIGQDFPLLSFESLGSLLYVLIMLIIISSFKWPFQYYDTAESHKESHRGWRIATVTIVIGGIIGFNLLLTSNNPNKSSKPSMGLEEGFLDTVKAKLDTLNVHFDVFQKSNPDLLSPDTLVQRFSDILHQNNDTTLKAIPFIDSSLTRFFTRGNKFDTRNLIYLRFHKGYYSFQFNEKYFFLKSPFAHNGWQGNLLDCSGNIVSRCAWVNGQYQHIYPRGEKSVWEYNYNNYLAEQASKDYIMRAPITLSFDYVLTDQLDSLLAHFTDVKLHEGQFKDHRSLNSFQLLTFSQKQHSNATGYQLMCANNGTVRLQSATDQSTCNIFNKDYLRLDSLYKNHNPMLLAREVNDKIERILDTEKQKGILIVAMDNTGRVRVMLDHSHEYKLNPNHVERYADLLNTAYLTNDVPVETGKLTNNCLLNDVSPGHGSVLKPIIYSAVTSQYKINGGWQSLKVEHHPANSSILYENVNGTTYIHYYAGKQVNAEWRDVWENKDHMNIDPVTYLSESINWYHAAIMCLGSYNKEQLNAMIRSSSYDPESTRFPHIMFGKSERQQDFDFNTAITRGRYDTVNSLLVRGLYINYGIKTDTTQYDTTTEKRYGGRIFSDPAHYYRQLRNTSKATQTYYNAIQNPSLGSYPIQLSALKVTEMCGKLAVVNRAFTYSFLDTPKHPQYEEFKYDGISTDEYFQHCKDDIFAPMGNEIFKHTMAGLINNNEGLIRRKNGDCIFIPNPNKPDTFYLYAKSGTPSDQSDKFGSRTGLFIISKTNLRMASIDEFKKAKYYVVYIMFKGIPNISHNYKMHEVFESRRAILKFIANSPIFEKDMQLN